jgi:hypothetical protein
MSGATLRLAERAANAKTINFKVLVSHLKHHFSPRLQGDSI